jgi:hypothetical protein
MRNILISRLRRGWCGGVQGGKCNLKLNGSILPGGPDFRQGVTLDTDETYTLIVWLGLSANTPQTFEITE